MQLRNTGTGTPKDQQWQGPNLTGSFTLYKDKARERGLEWTVNLSRYTEQQVSWWQMMILKEQSTVCLTAVSPSSRWRRWMDEDGRRMVKGVSRREQDQSDHCVVA
jgi:hypothetical protein